MNDFRLESLLDLPAVNQMAESLYAATSMPMGIVDAHDDKVLLSVGWQDVCVKFHRVNDITSRRCRESDNYIKRHLAKGEDCRYQCKNGLWDCAIPLIVTQHHLATMFFGQFFFAGEVPRQQYFIDQAKECGFDLDEYLSALEKVPVLDRQKVESSIEYNKALASFLSEQAERALLMSVTEKALVKSHSRYRELFNNAPVGILLADDKPKIFDANVRAAELTGYSQREICSSLTSQLIQPEVLNGSADQKPQKVSVIKRAVVYESVLTRKNNSEVPVEVNLFVSPETGYHTVIFQDITERKRTEESRRRSREELEEKVHERTAELSSTVEALKRRNFESETLSRLGELLQACETEEESYVIVASMCRQLFNCQSGYLATYDDESHLVRPVERWGYHNGIDIEFELRDCWALRRGVPHLVLDTQNEPVCIHTDKKSEFTTLCIPIGAKGELLGLLHLFWGEKDGDMRQSYEEMQYITGLAKRVAEMYALSLSNVRLRLRLRRQSIRDSLTSLYNRRHMEESLDREIARARRKDTAVGVILFDIDHFKSFNDTHGHESGDLVLRNLGKLINELTRDEDIPCRYGVEEFLVILPECDMESVAKRAEDLRRGIENIPIFINGRLLRVSVSLGVASYPEHGDCGNEIVAMADDALNKAKLKGRNRVEVAATVVLEPE